MPCTDLNSMGDSLKDLMSFNEMGLSSRQEELFRSDKRQRMSPISTIMDEPKICKNPATAALEAALALDDTDLSFDYAALPIFTSCAADSLKDFTFKDFCKPSRTVHTVKDVTRGMSRMTTTTTV